jgi:hypothetical protein
MNWSAVGAAMLRHHEGSKNSKFHKESHLAFLAPQEIEIGCAPRGKKK